MLVKAAYIMSFFLKNTNLTDISKYDKMVDVETVSTSTIICKRR